MKYTTTQKIVQIIFEGFENYFEKFRQVTQSVQPSFEQGNYQAIHQLANQRYSLYHQALLLALEQILDTCPELENAQEDWTYLKQEYIITIQDHPAGEIAETFFNSIFCRLYNHQHLHNDYLFVHKSHYKHRRTGNTPSNTYETYQVTKGLFQTIYELIQNFGFDYENLDRDVGLITASLQQRISPRFLKSNTITIDVIKSVFYRNKRGYIVGKLQVQGILIPFILPILNVSGKIIIDTLITNPNTVSIIFSFAQSCFLVDVPVPSLLVEFLQALLPDKLIAELYNSIGFSSHGKTTFHRQFIAHIKKAPDEMVLWQDAHTSNLTTFTLPSFNMVFRVLHNPETLPLKQTSITEKYRQLAHHNRVGRMTEAFEFQNFVFPKEIISEEVLDTLLRNCSALVNVSDNQQILIKHLLIERRMVPLDLFLTKANVMARKLVIHDYGWAIKQLASANILPGNLSFNSFGVSQHNRVICYNYENVQWLSESLPETITQVTREFETLLNNDASIRDDLTEVHQDLLDFDYWTQVQDKVKSGEIPDIYPYEKGLRFNNKTHKYSF